MTIYRMGRPAVKPRRAPQGKKQRLARQSDRDIAANLARAYRSQTPYVWKPDPAEGGVMRKVPIDGADLARMLERFAATGTFERPTAYERLTRARVARHIDAALKADGADYYERTDAIMAVLGGSTTGAYAATTDAKIAELRAAVARYEAAIAVLQKGATPLK